MPRMRAPNGAMISRVNRRTVLAAAGAALAMPAISRVSRANEQIVLGSYGGTIEEFMREEAIPPFEKETGISVVYVVGTALGNYSKILATRSNPEMDIYWANDMSHLSGKVQGLYDTLDPALIPNLAKVYPTALDADGIGVASNMAATGLEYNSARLREAGLEPPTSWLDLWDPKYHGRVAMCSIGILQTQDFLAMMTRILGGSEQDIGPAIAKIKELRDSGNIVNFANSPAEMDNVMVQEQAWIGVNSTTRTLALQDRGFPVEYVQPSEGGPMHTILLDVVKGAANPTGAHKFINHMLGEEVQSGIARALAYAPVNPGASIPENYRQVMPSDEAGLATFISLDRVTMNQNLDRWIETWNREIES
ncbi:ABC transporter substrate-binding protein [Mesorhizobium sp. M7A.F.Ca.US.006.01.1.1]|uniref:ABC transporter substrate-binding protein n=1 Tax=Mesorhizobium sp. M7A.F.Ca.US.006.01.1.1 TaxID=2496707 RepID=UPI000FCA8FF9|nr:ABC transporter substrate-binding protein [Mesorhizobium sp. M7A.F.Ca.US.006.01.1.1]RUZ73497.1 ABC transporter substrate-binding protein [Mesorhizobium sp. M7A.F.Ca.US.006.01.1.1]